MAGNSTRYNQNGNKTLTKINQKEIYTYSENIFNTDEDCKEIYLVVNKNDYENLKQNHQNIILGGQTRLQSVQNAIKQIIDKFDYCIIHDAARPLIKKEDLELIKENLKKNDGVTLYEETTDTIRYQDKEKIIPLKRENLLRIITPQGFTNKAMQEIIKADYKNENYTDEISILLEKEFKIAHIKTPHPSPKLTTKNDLDYITYLINKDQNLDPNQNYKIGHSFDFHPFVDGDILTIGGVNIPFNKKLKGWSDADVLYHTIAESIIGALGLIDLGTLYPDNDEKYHGIKSNYFLNDMQEKLKKYNYEIINIDSIIYLEKPNLKNYKQQMKNNIAKELNIDNSIVNVKATTMEKKGLIGNGEGIAAEAVVLLKYNKI